MKNDMKMEIYLPDSINICFKNEKEYLVLNSSILNRKEEIEINPGDVSFAILSIDNQYLEKVTNEIRKSLVEDDFVPPVTNRLNCLKHSLKKFYKYETNIDDIWKKLFFIYIPFAFGITRQNNLSYQIEFERPFADEARKEIFSFIKKKIAFRKTPDEFIYNTINNQFENYLKEWYAFLLDKEAIIGQKTSLRKFKKEKSIFLGEIIYLKEIIRIIQELKTIKPKLESFMDRCSDANTNELEDWLKNIPCFKAGDVEYYTSIHSIVRQEMLYFQQNNKYIKTCELCNRRFIAKRRDTRFCKCPNPEYGNRTCNIVGPSENNKSKMNDLDCFYRKERETYERWKKRVKTSAREIGGKPNSGIKESDIKDIIKEINKNYGDWQKTCDEAIEDYNTKKITEESAKSIIKCPKVKERSPLFYKMRNENKVLFEKEQF